MRILGVVGSPRRERGLCHQVVSRVLSGARGCGADTEILYLIDEEPQYCIHCGHACFIEGNCVQEEKATVRSQRVEDADALVIGVPVYVWQPNGLTAAFFDKVRLSTGPWTRGSQHGRPALGMAVAGGSGTGVFPALQSIYAWLCLWKFRPLDPLPVTRFNLAGALEDAESLGQALAQSSPRPFEGPWDVMLTYDSLPYMDYARIDEFRWLSEQIAAGLEARGEQESTVGEIRRLLDEGRACAAKGDRRGEAKRCIDAYRMGARVW